MRVRMTVCFVRSPTLSQMPKKDHKDKAKKSIPKKRKRKGHSRYHSYINNNNTTKRDFLRFYLSK